MTDKAKTKAITISFSGKVLANTLPSFRQTWAEGLETINLAPRTDDEFSALGAFCTKCQSTEKLVKAALADAMNENADVALIIDEVESFLKEVRDTRLAANKAVVSNKVKTRLEITTAGRNEIIAFAQSIKDEFQSLFAIKLFDTLDIIEESIKGKSSFDVMRKTVAALVLEMKLTCNKRAAHFLEMIDLVDNSKYPELFSDKATVCQMSIEIVESTISSRIATKELADQKKKEALLLAEKKKKEDERIDEEALKLAEKKAADEKAQAAVDKQIAEVKAKAEAHLVAETARLKTEAAVAQQKLREQFEARPEPAAQEEEPAVPKKEDPDFPFGRNEDEDKDKVIGNRRQGSGTSFVFGGRREPAEEKPKSFDLELTACLRCTESQRKELKRAIAALLESSPFVENFSIK